ncbi:CHAT domain-containing protein [Oscillatoria sp. CS-180]|uniref:CHAT domain-containing protein n=1 Tax=Oscillatoria sp. CS-180 TaxID=3021720 RepID=UPI00232C41AA|nr:CHAT domain-containing protein [Oscillatoria sp. CS-180]MDB9527528.1 CHAT domain-containing protein [Oscillatoria sp. CS-180]
MLGRNNMGRSLRYGLLMLLAWSFVLASTATTFAQSSRLAEPEALTVSIEVTQATAQLDQAQSNQAQSNQVQLLLEQGQQRYQAEQFVAAVSLWQEALPLARSETDRITVNSYLALAYQALGQVSAAEESLGSALSLLGTVQNPLLTAQVLNIQGSLQFHQGQPQNALAIWQQAEENYRAVDDIAGIVLSRINQIQALRSLGYYPRARRLIVDLRQDIEAQPNSLLKAQGLQTIGITLRTVGESAASEAVLTESLTIAQSFNSPEATAQTLFQLGNTALAAEHPEAALAWYQQAQTDLSSDSRLWLEIALNELRLLANTEQWDAVEVQLPTVRSRLDTLAPSRWGIYAHINLATTLASQRSSSLPQPLPLLTRALQQARTIEDVTAEAYALGQLGELYEQAHQWSEALALTDQAIQLAQQTRADEIAASNQWQRGRILKASGNADGAIAAYNQAVTLLESLDQDLVALNSEAQFSFRQQVEPVYRQLVQLLLQTVDTLPSDQQQQRLARSREVIESLQLAELENFFREACLTYVQQPIDEIDPQAAVFYPILLGDRLEVILSLPGQPLQHYGNPLPQETGLETFLALRQALNPAFLASEVLPPAQQFYDWLLRPAETSLEQQGIQRLVFVLDGYLRSVPMAVLHDGNQFLVERYGLALTPGLQLFESLQSSNQALSALAAGITVPRQGFNALPAVDTEIAQIQSQLSTRVLLNQDFTDTKMAETVVENPVSIVHLATHGQFSSKADETFILTWSDRLQLRELEGLLQQRELQTPLELLVLSACQTAKGDERAALGMAGVAIRSGARSTVASLWSVQDQSTAELMTEFYRQLTQNDVTRADALRRAQLSVFQRSKYAHPYYWAPFVLIGNWL